MVLLPVTGLVLWGCTDEQAAQPNNEDETTAQETANIPDLNEWDVHATERPNPDVITPPVPDTPRQPGEPPSDAVILFGGENLSAWQTPAGDPAPWQVENEYFEVVPGTGYIQTKQGFGDVQLHIEWATPEPAEGEGQDRGNSGVFFMGQRYEVQILDSFENQTYADGQAAAIYGQYPPMVNASRAPGQWQTYDIIFRRPHFDTDGNVTAPATITVFHNGVLVQDHVRLTGPTAHKERPPYEQHAAALPISLQDHDHPVRFRNVWVRELPAD
jgi:hypothetical protein